MNLSQYATSAGLVGQGWREEEDAMRLAREQQLRTEELNRLNQFRQEMTAAPMPAAPQYDLSSMAAPQMANVSMQGTQPMAPTGVQHSLQHRLRLHPWLLHRHTPVCRKVRQTA
jgi:hypothetical protein